MAGSRTGPKASARSRTRTGSARIPAILVVDGGNSKTDVALLDSGGHVLGFARGGGSSHKDFGVEGSMDVLDRALAAVVRAAGFEPDGRPVAHLGMFCLAGADLPVDDRRLARAIRSRGW